jgi:hypothetical protein
MKLLVDIATKVAAARGFSPIVSCIVLAQLFYYAPIWSRAWLHAQHWGTWGWTPMREFLAMVILQMNLLLLLTIIWRNSHEATVAKKEKLRLAELAAQERAPRIAAELASRQRAERERNDAWFRWWRSLTHEQQQAAIAEQHRRNWIGWYQTTQHPGRHHGHRHH